MPVKSKENTLSKLDKPDNLPTRAKTVKAKEEGNFMVLSNSSDMIMTGSKLIVVNVSRTLEAAEKYITELTSSRPEYLCVVEKKVFYSRRPQMIATKI